MTLTALRASIELVAAQYDVPPSLVEAIVLVESGGDPFAIRHEPSYRWLVNVKTRQPFRSLTPSERVSAAAPPDFPAGTGRSADTEWMQQRTSWGLMQIMGALARELGYTEPFLSSLCDPVANLRLGCRHLSSLLAWAHGDTHRAIRAFNGGRGGADLPATEDYLQKVLKHL